MYYYFKDFSDVVHTPSVYALNDQFQEVHTLFLLFFFAAYLMYS